MVFTRKDGDFHGRTVSLPEGIQQIFHPYLGKCSNLTNIFQMGWNHQLENFLKVDTDHLQTSQ